MTNFFFNKIVWLGHFSPYKYLNPSYGFADKFYIRKNSKHV